MFMIRTIRLNRELERHHPPGTRRILQYMGEKEERDATAGPVADPQRFKRLPERVKLEDTVESQDTNTARDPEGGRDTDRDFMIRYSGG
jgi:hypothetical protein